MILETSVKIREEYPGTKTNYLDANFPFWDGFPLLPHLSHNDGKKLDIDYIYRDTKTGKRVLKGPSFTGYGICEEPEAGEIDQPLICEEKAYWQYSLLRSLTPQHSKGKYKFDPDANKLLLQMLAHHPDCSKIFIEPHLKQRLGLEKYNKIRFHGCQSVRHDDHIHMQL